MTPDKTIQEDLAVGCFALLFIIPVLWVALTHGQFGYTPADECANTIKDSISYTKKKILIDNEPTYPNIRSWCEQHLDRWELKLNEAKDYQTPDYQY